ncbi:MAG TPA: NAD(P)-dependent oxidoreductase, partial [Planctomycetota bacterium]|nr:NAD(P)-dependent oxidoreductase [Planctomycetota bacterium]
ELPAALAQHPLAEPRRIDLSGGRGAPEAALAEACAGVDGVVHCAGRLFAPHPERYLVETNLRWVERAAAAAVAAGASRFVLLSFPHVEEHTTPEQPATGRLDVFPAALHARTRLAAERALIAACDGASTSPVILRLGIVYGPDMRLIRAARWLLRRRLLAIWREPTWLHLLALPDAVAAVTAALERPGVRGVYNVCDEQPLSVQAFLDQLADAWGHPRPRRLPAWCFRAAAAALETAAGLAGTSAPLHRDMLRMGMTSAVADTSRCRRELLPELVRPTLAEGLADLR